MVSGREYITACLILHLNGKDFMSYGAYKNHISIVLGHKLVEFMQESYPQHIYTLCTIKFPNDATFPYELIRTICELLWKSR